MVGLRLVSKNERYLLPFNIWTEQADVEKCTTCGSLLKETKYKCEVLRGARGALMAEPGWQARRART
jgi:hypothetical protein